MKLILDPEGTAIDLAKAPLSVEDIKVTPGKKKIDLVTNPRTDGAVPFGRAATDVMMMEISIRVDEQATLEEGLAELRKVSQLLDEIENQLPAGLPLEETPDNSETSSTAYVLLGEVSEIPREMSGDQLGWYHKAPFAVLTLTCEPFYEGPEEEAGEVEGEDLIELEIAEVKGDVEAPALAVITAKGGENIRHYELGQESRYYDSAEPAPTLIEGDEFETEGFQGEQVEAAWAESSKAVKASLVAQPVTVCSTGAQEHIGQWREKLRFKASSTDVYVRLAYRVGDGSWGRSAWLRAPVAEAAVEQFIDLINIPEAALGGQRWEGRIEAYSSAEGGGDTIEVDRLENIPAENWLQLSAPAVLDTAKVFVARDDFTVNGKSYLVEAEDEQGNAYTALGAPEEDPDKIVYAAASDYVVRAWGGPEPFGRAEGLAGLELTDTAVSIDLRHDELTDDAARHGILVRVADGENFLKCYVRAVTGGSGDPQDAGPLAVHAQVVIGGEVKLELSHELADSLLNWQRMLVVVIGEEFLVYFGRRDGTQTLLFRGYSDYLGSTIAQGDVYLWDQETELGATSRNWDRLYVWEPELGIVAYSGQDLRVDDEEAERYDPTGSYLAPVPNPRGRAFKLPPSGDRDRAVRLVSKARVNDVDSEFDTVEGSKHRLRVVYRPRYRFPADA